jgi:two-component system sensor histidine kinase CiaH
MASFTNFFRSKNFSFWFWVLFAYVVAALIWWFISLEKQNAEMSLLRKERLDPAHHEYVVRLQQIGEEKSRNTTKYLSEGVTFLILIIIGAIMVYRSVRKQMSYVAMQRNFMMAVTHELKTPIATTRLSLETLKHRQLDTDRQQRVIDNALSETTRLDVLTNNILLASQIEEKGFIQQSIPFSLSALLIKIAADYRHRFSRRIMEEKIEPDIWIKGDERMIQIAVNNLMDNALKYSADTAPVLIHMKAEKDHCRIEVVDGGEGVPDNEKKKIFRKFYRSGNEITRKTKGTGLGLYLTSKIIEHHQGRLFVKDHLPKGSIFVIELKKQNVT